MNLFYQDLGSKELVGECYLVAQIVRVGKNT